VIIRSRITAERNSYRLLSSISEAPT